MLTASAVAHLLRLLAAAGRGAGAHTVRARGPCGRSVCCSSAGPEPGTARSAVALLRGTGHRCTAASSPELLLHHSGQGQGAPVVPLAWPCTRQGPVAPRPLPPAHGGGWQEHRHPPHVPGARLTARSPPAHASTLFPRSGPQRRRLPPAPCARAPRRRSPRGCLARVPQP